MDFLVIKFLQKVFQVKTFEGLLKKNSFLKVLNYLKTKKSF